MNVDKDLKALDDLNEALKNILEFSENYFVKFFEILSSTIYIIPYFLKKSRRFFRR